MPSTLALIINTGLFVGLVSAVLAVGSAIITLVWRTSGLVSKVLGKLDEQGQTLKKVQRNRKKDHRRLRRLAYEVRELKEHRPVWTPEQRRKAVGHE